MRVQPIDLPLDRSVLSLLLWRHSLYPTADCQMAKSRGDVYWMVKPSANRPTSMCGWQREYSECDPCRVFVVTVRRAELPSGLWRPSTGEACCDCDRGTSDSTSSECRRGPGRARPGRAGPGVPGGAAPTAVSRIMCRCQSRRDTRPGPAGTTGDWG